MVRLNDITSQLLSYYPQADISLVEKAYVYSAKVHQGQVRLSGEPYLSHPLEVAYILAQMKMDVVTVVAGLLHDAIEDTHADAEEIERLFGPETAKIVDGVTKISKIPFSTSEERQAENMRKMILAMATDIRVILVKLADRLHNMQTLGFQTPQKQEEIARETLEIYAPLAGRMGIYWLKSTLEDLCLYYLEPEIYEKIKNALAERRGNDGGVHPRGDRAPLRQTEGIRDPGRDQGEEQAFLQHLLQDEGAEPDVQPGVRHRGVQGHRQIPEGVLRSPGPHPLHVEAGFGALQGLHLAPQGQHVPVPPHHGDRPPGAADGDPDPHLGDGSRRGAGDRVPLEVQGGRECEPQRSEAVCVAQTAAGMAAERPGPQGVHGDDPAGPLPERGLCLHAQRGR